MHKFIAAICLMVFSSCSSAEDPSNMERAIASVPDTTYSAFYMVQGEDLRGDSIPGQPFYDISEFDLLVCNASLNPDKIKEINPNATVLAYVPMRFVASWGPNQKTMNEWRDSFEEENFFHDSDGNRISSTWPNTDELIYTYNTAIRLVRYIYTHFSVERNWDGIYLDDFSEDIPERMFVNDDKRGLKALPISRYSAQVFWDYYRNSVVSGLRSLNFTGKIVCNVGDIPNEILSLEIDGVCSEEWWPSFRSQFLQSASKFDRLYNVTWEWRSSSNIARNGIIRYREHRKIK